MKNQPGTIKNHENRPGTKETIKKPTSNNEQPPRTMKNHEKPTWKHEKP